ncbi:MAG: lipocalin-like domain-containing protein [Myxococcales bacterium]|nr:lipocalin-like domain-containing protein [Myxococcales bacterium]MCH7866541.1 lipocalin-like domain-containing protein [Myxococcales bacterium]
MHASSLVGTWALRRFELCFPDGRITHPYGEDVTGLLFYDDTGHMSAAFGSAKREAGASLDLEEVGTKPAYDAFMAYCGSYEVEQDRIVHRVEVSSLAAWAGTVQERRFKIEDGRLTLVTMPLVIGADAPTGRLVWDRVGADKQTR